LSGMSYGFLAEQLPTVLSELLPAESFLKNNNLNLDKQDFFYIRDDLHVVVQIKEGKFVIKVPDVWVLTQRSGSNKTKLDEKNDLLLLGLVKG
uniref:hypothetical protein n=1 Tax=Pseudomonas marginalis TaxID=298 RepID=UPI002B1CB86E